MCAYVRSSIDSNIYKCPSSINNVGKVSVEIMWLTCFYKGQSYFIACCYHPPKPVYHPQYFVHIFRQEIEFIVSSHSDSIILICEDFNSLSTEFLEIDYGLVQLVLTPTHETNLLDKFFVNQSDLYCVEVIKSLLKTKHKALYAHGAEPFLRCEVRPKAGIKVYDLRQHNIDRLRNAIALQDWNSLISCSSNDIDYIYSNFVTLIHECIATSIPTKQVKIGPRDPPFVTPLVEST